MGNVVIILLLALLLGGQWLAWQAYGAVGLLPSAAVVVWIAWNLRDFIGESRREAEESRRRAAELDAFLDRTGGVSAPIRDNLEKAKAGELDAQVTVIADMAARIESPADRDFVAERMADYFRIATEPAKTGEPQHRYVDFAFLRAAWPPVLVRPFIRKVLERYAAWCEPGSVPRHLDFSRVESLLEVEDEIIWRWLHCLIGEISGGRQDSWHVEYVKGDKGQKAASLLDYGNPYGK